MPLFNMGRTSCVFFLNSWLMLAEQNRMRAALYQGNKRKNYFSRMIKINKSINDIYGCLVIFGNNAEGSTHLFLNGYGIFTSLCLIRN